MTYRTMISALCLSASTAMPAFSSDLPKRIEDVVRVELLPGWRLADGTHMAGLSFELANGWKTYWRSPGDGGLPTRLDHSRSDNIADLQVMWPRPDVFRTRGIRSIGYEKAVVLPLHLHPKNGEDIDLDLTLHFGVCEDVCIPVTLEISEQLTAATIAADSRIETALDQQPSQADGAVSCQFQKAETGGHLTVSFEAPALPGFGEAVVIETATPDIWVSEPEMQRVGERIVATSHMVPYASDDLDATPDAIRVTVISSQAATSFEGCSEF